MSNLQALMHFDKRQIFRFFVDGHFLKKYRGWLGYEEREPGSVQAMLNGFSYIMDNFDLSSGVTAGYIKGLHKACTFNVFMKNPKTTPGDMRYLESYYLLHAGDVSIESVEELIELRRGDYSLLFYEKEFAKTAEELDAKQIHQFLQNKSLKYRPWYPILSLFQIDSLNLKNTLADFYVVKHYIQIQYASKIDSYINEFNFSILHAINDQDKLFCISRFVRKLELLHPFPDGNGRTYVPALMNHLLLYYGFFPAILYNPNLDAEYSTVEWAMEIERGMENTKALLSNPSLNLYNFSIDQITKEDNDKFLELAKEFIDKFSTLCARQKPPLNKKSENRSIPNYLVDINTKDIHDFMHVLKKCNENYVYEDNFGILHSDIYDSNTGTFLQSLECSTSLSNEDLATFKILKYINGDLNMRDSLVTCIDGLNNLISITGNLILNHSRIENLDGLNNLVEINNIELYGLMNLSSITGFSKLLHVKGRIYIATNSKLNSINGFNSLNRIDASIYIVNNLRLTSINGFNSLSKIESGSLELKNNDSLQQINGFSILSFIADTFSINNCPKLESLTQPAQLESVVNISINRTGIYQIHSLTRLFQYQPKFPGYIKISSNQLTSISFMKGLKSAGSSLYLHDNKLTNLKGLEDLETVNASLTLSLNQLTDISQLSSLRSVNGVLTLSNNQLTSLHGLESLNSIKTKDWGGSRLSIKLNVNRGINGEISLTDISALSNLKEFNGKLIIYIDENNGFEYTPNQDSIFYTKNNVTFQALPDFAG